MAQRETQRERESEGRYKLSRRACLFGGTASLFGMAVGARAQAPETITLESSDGPIAVRPLKHGSVLVQFKNKNYYVDPAQLPPADYPKADAILITHEHGDHLDPKAVAMLRKDGTVIVINPRGREKLGEGIEMKNGDTRSVLDLKVDAVPAYNIERPQYHPKGRDNGYILTAGGKRLYLAGDTEGTPEMKALRNIDLAFLPINLPYTMPPADAAAAAREFRPKILVPYHQGQSNPREVAEALQGTGIDVRVMRL